MNARFVLLSASTQIPASTFPLKQGSLILGRSSKCDLIVKDHTVSRRHAEIAVASDDINVRDLDSHNGTFVNHTRVGAATLKIGQIIMFGDVVFRLVLAAPDGRDPNSDADTDNVATAKLPCEHLLAKLSKAQQRVVAVIQQGLSEKQAAKHLKLSPTTIHNHLQAIYRAFKVHSRSELLVRLLSKNDER